MNDNNIDRNDTENNKSYLSDSNDDINNILRDRMEAKRKLKKREYEKLSKKSFILKNKQDDDEVAHCNKGIE